jgi:hypothetical protein
MMHTRPLFTLTVGAALLATLTACGSSDRAPTASTAPVSSFVESYNQGLASVSVMSSTAFADLIDDSYLDGGTSKSQILASIKADADSVAGSPPPIEADSVFPALSIKDAVISGCDDTTGVCLLTATYVNPAPDGSTSVTAVPVRYKDGRYRLYGDQKAAG